MSESKDNFQPTSVLFTGGAGFIGSNVMVHLISKFPDCKFICLDKIEYCATENNFTEVLNNPNFKFVKGDILASDLVLYLLREYKVDTILHFAAQTHVDNSFGNSIVFTQSNVVGTHVLLECAKTCKDQIKRFIHVSTDEVYGESTLSEDDKSFDERSALNPTNPYAATKAAAEFMAKAYRISFDLPIIITRGNNVYGPKQFPEKLIPKFITLLEQRKPCPIHGNGQHRRSYLHVDDVSRAFEIILKQGKLGQIYNIGTEFEVSNLETTRTLLKIFGLEKDEAKYINHVSDRAFNDVRYNIAGGKLRELGWAPSVEFEEGLKQTIQWYRDHPNHWGDVSAALQPHPRIGTRPV